MTLRVTPEARRYVDAIRAEFGSKIANLVKSEGSRLENVDNVLDADEARSAYDALRRWRAGGQNDKTLFTSLQTFLQPQLVATSPNGESELRINVGTENESVARGRLVNGLRDGPWVIERADGGTERITYRQGVKEGDARTEFNSGYSTCRYVNGQVQGTLEIHYTRDQAAEYNPDGSTRVPAHSAGDLFSQEMQEGQVHGLSRNVAANGTVVYEATFMRGVRHGEVIRRDRETGEVTSREVYSRGVLVKPHH